MADEGLAIKMQHNATSRVFGFEKLESGMGTVISAAVGYDGQAEIWAHTDGVKVMQLDAKNLRLLGYCDPGAPGVMVNGVRLTGAMIDAAIDACGLSPVGHSFDLVKNRGQCECGAILRVRVLRRLGRIRPEATRSRG